MSTRSGLISRIVKYSIPTTVGSVAYTNGGLPITTLDAGRWLCCLSYAIDPVNAGATLTSVSYAVTQTAVLGGGGAVGLLQHVQSATTGADVIGKSANCSVFQITAENTPIFLSITAVTSAGNYVSSALALDAQSSVISFVKLE
jgi:hypothetical protein